MKKMIPAVMVFIFIAYIILVVMRYAMGIDLSGVLMLLVAIQAGLCAYNHQQKVGRDRTFRFMIIVGVLNLVVSTLIIVHSFF